MESESPSPLFPERIFAIGEEPLGIRVTPYHKPSSISKILNALDEEELRFIRESSFGKLIEIADKPSFSGRLGRFLFSRQLKVRKRHEAWFLFAGKPIRFSIREFALVTGLNCRSYPPNPKKRSKKFDMEKPYWGELFGSMTEVPVSYVITMLKKKTVTDTGMRIKYALLALLSSVILPTSHNPRILQAAAEKIKDVDQFLSYPWGRASFDMLMSSIKERNEISLSQNTIAFKGFVMSVQLVLLEAVPSLTGVVREGPSSGSEAESEEDEEMGVVDRGGKKSINTVHIRAIDSACKVNVISITSDGVDLTNLDTDAAGSDDDEDVLVDNLVKAAGEGFPFTNSHFKGGATKADVTRMRDEAKKEKPNRKNARANAKQPVAEGPDGVYIATIVKNILSEELVKMGEQIKETALFLRNSQNLFEKNMQDILNKSLKEIANSFINTSSHPHVTQPVQTEAHIAGGGSIPTVNTNSNVASDIILEAMRFANKESIPPSNATEDNTGDGGGGIRRFEDIYSGTFAPESHPIDPNSEDVLKDAHDSYMDIEEPPAVGDVRDVEDPEAEDTEANRTADVDETHDSYMDTEEPPAVGDVRVVEDTEAEDAEANRTVDMEETAEQLNSPQSNIKETSVDDSTNIGKANQETVASGLSFPGPSFSIGLTQLNKTNADTGVHVIQPLDEEDSLLEPAVENAAPIINRKSKRARVVPRNLVGDYQCDKRFLTRAWESYVNAICSTPGIDYSAKFAKLLEILGGSPFVIDFGGLTVESSELSAIVHRSSHLPAKLLDVLLNHTRSVFLSNPEHIQSKNSVFLDTKFVSLLAKSFSKFSNAAKKENVRFPAAIFTMAAADCPIAEVSRLYFPFNFDKHHWVGVCVDVPLNQVIVLDCNTSLKTDTTVATDLRPFTQMFPYILRQGGRQLSVKEMKPFTIDRPRSVPQNSNMFDSGITSTLLLQAHAVGGVDVCKCINSEVLETEVQRIAVMMYEENVAVL